ncbi:TIR domain-containing protein [Methyloceanibacter sp.]|uniref:TIR domain-containing protein n=1 Tax=Methyloceanibacter sp. TaxID=1965321 RepID=UPI003C76BA08
MKSTSPRSHSLGTTGRQPACPHPPPAGSGQASPRDNVVFEAGLFGGVLGMHRTFILHAKGSKLPSDLLGFTCVRYGEANPSEMRAINESFGRRSRVRAASHASRACGGSSRSRRAVHTSLPP